MSKETVLSNKEIILIGAGGHCSSCIDVIEQEGRFRIAGIVDKSGDAESGKREAGSAEHGSGKAEVLGYPVIGTDDDLPELRKKFQYALVTVGQIKTPDVRIRLFDRLLEIGFVLPTIVSPLAYVSPHARIGQGTIVMHHALINAGATVGNNCIINSKALVEHDAVIEDHCHISTGVIVNGEARIGSGSFLGSGCRIKEGISLGENCLVGMGISVRKDQPGNARILT
ncbi:acetyltransferase [Desulfonatronovibrio magnus]|uniref:acetyltransferase n=1 Tax=Desulfonatronovibrio magnus TaxID=698827 RepID=UPI0005EAD774|nr:acetyltransferase [Desulfonatronovibrio magnus]